MKARNIKIEDYLKIDPVKRKNVYGLYYSPFRKEDHPSFKIDYNKNLWYDYGLGKGGSIVDLVMELKRCDFSEACNELESSAFSFHWENSLKEQKSTSTTEIVKINKPNNRVGKLMQYCNSRGINTDIVSANLKQIHYTNNGKPFISFGMCNVLDGWEVIGLNRFKMVIGKKSYSLIKGIGSENLIVFEGIFDYLSYLMLSNGATIPKFDCVVLNNVNVVKQAIGAMQDYSKVHCILDNDDAGQRCLSFISDTLGADKVMSYDFYKEHNDLNDYLLSRLI